MKKGKIDRLICPNQTTREKPIALTVASSEAVLILKYGISFFFRKVRRLRNLMFLIHALIKEPITLTRRQLLLYP